MGREVSVCEVLVGNDLLVTGMVGSSWEDDMLSGTMRWEGEVKALKNLPIDQTEKLQLVRDESEKHVYVVF